MSALICGSFAYDNIMVFPDHFKNHILPDKVHMLNVCFMVPEMRREFGGCAGNISFNLNLLGGDAVPMGTVGKDFDPYRYWMNKNKIDQTHVKVIEDVFTGQAFITTDLDRKKLWPLQSSYPVFHEYFCPCNEHPVFLCCSVDLYICHRPHKCLAGNALPL